LLILRLRRLESVAIPDKLAAGEVLVKMIAAPVTEFDASFIAGFGAKRTGIVLPATAGNEGLGVVQGVGAGVEDISEGDHVMPTISGVGEFSAAMPRPRPPFRTHPVRLAHIWLCFSARPELSSMR
jgi:NADPH:quinone reductase-like Zn-dependent oxidoreductase